MPHLFSRFPGFYRSIAFLALLAMLVPMFVALAHQPVMAGEAPTHLCHQPRGDQNGGNAPAHKIPVCPICKSMHLLGAGFVAPDAVAVGTISGGGDRLVTVLADFMLSRTVATSAQPRAPPFLI